MIGPIWIGVQIRGRDGRADADGRGRIDKSTLFDPLLCLFEVDLLDGRSEGWTGTEIAAFFRGFEKVICPLGHGRYGQGGGGGGGKAVRIGPPPGYHSKFKVCVRAAV